MEYRVSLTARTARDLELIYEFIQAEGSDKAFTWFNDLVAKIQSLERYPERGSIVPESKKYRQLLFGKKPDVYRIVYEVAKRQRAVLIVQIRHGARAPAVD